MNAREIREKADELGQAIKGLVSKFEKQTDTTVTDLAMVRENTLGQNWGKELICIQVGVKVA
jgi:hypothetical protein